MKNLILMMFILICLNEVNAQYYNKRDRENVLAFDLQTGGTLFYGDISRDGIFPQSRNDKKDYGTAFSFSVKVQNKYGYDIRLAFISGTLNGVRYVPKTYQVYFKNEFQEFDLTTAFDPFNKRRQFKKLKTSGVVGFGFMNYRTQLRSLATDRLISSIGYSSRDLGYLQLKEESRKTDMVWIAGISLSYNIHPNFDLLFEHTYHIASSSKLDALASGSFNDRYSFTSLGVCFKVK